MKLDAYSDNPVKSFVRQEADYNDAGLDPVRTIVLPFTTEDDRESIEAKGINWAGLMRQANQVYKENIGNSYAAKARVAFANEKTPPGQPELDELVRNYDFSGARISSESGMPEGERIFRSTLRARLKDLLRFGVFSEDPEAKLTVQTQREATQEELPPNKISIEDFETLVESAAECAVFEYEDRDYDFSGDPEFEYDEEGNVASYRNLAAVPAHCNELAEAKLERDRSMKAVRASIPPTAAAA